MGLHGWVLNSAQGALVEIEGHRTTLDAFLLRLAREQPSRAAVHSLETTFLDPAGYDHFEIRHSEDRGPATAIVMADIATCPDCLSEIHDPTNRRYRYPFTNCTNCGPRFSIIEALPYDRPRTSMRAFEMCAECRCEYDNPLDRRFHAQPNACPVCGPRLTLWDAAGRTLAVQDAALLAATAAVRAGQVVALKGLGGFHLVTLATDEPAVARLRARKHRAEKPLALMYPSLAAVRAHCRVSPLEARLLQSPEAPIVLLDRHSPDTDVAPSVAPCSPSLGVMLPYTPLHHLLLTELSTPIVATSGNRADEPICTNEREARGRLDGLADLFLVHDRPIVRHVDDSVARVMLGREIVLRRARGYAPLPVPLGTDAPPLLAVGAHLKSTVAVTNGREVFISQHLGDLDTAEAAVAFRRATENVERLFRITPALVAADMHPDYFSSRHARGLGLPIVEIQHHVAHAAACLAENELAGPALGVSWDGTGLGPDGTIWGGEFLVTDGQSFRRAATFHGFRLPGGERAIREPRRAAIGLLFELLGSKVGSRRDLAPVRAFDAPKLARLIHMIECGLNAPVTSSVGRLFDAVAALVGLRQIVTFEGQAAMDLEFAVPADDEAGDGYPFQIADAGPASMTTDEQWQAAVMVDWRPTVAAILDDLARRVSTGTIAARFHDTLATVIVAVAHHLGEPHVALTGGCFQNRRLTERVVARLRTAGFRPYWHQRVPPNDGGIALGQAVAAMRYERADGL
jgi:hydrogenase maturation protein HypF